MNQMSETMSESETESNTAPPTFDSLPLSQELRQAVDELGYTHPTPVQRAVFEPAARGRDLVVQARTGTGKTAAFGMPLIDSVVKKGTAEVQALILCPTRELGLQVSRELEALGKHRGVKVAAVYGGAPMPKQVQQIQDGAQIVAGTPGRVLDHLRRGTLDASSIKSFVLDESDEMLSMGFLPQITDIMGFLPESHQTLLFSATLPPAISRMAETKLTDPEFITLSGDQVGALEIDHFVYLTRGDKIAELIQVIEIENPESAIVFCNTRDDTKRVASALQAAGFRGGLAERGPGAERPREGDGGDAQERAALPGGDRRGRARHRHLAPHPRHQLRLPRVDGKLRPPHRAHRARGSHRNGDLAHHAQRHRQPVPAPADVQDPPDREAAAQPARAEDARRGGPWWTCSRSCSRTSPCTRTISRSPGACSRTSRPKRS